ncbi:hypothetical protein SUGI_1179210 [Cryptomeria japonica]|nr:hypothetical protein SUGI_1179210 [Cryptomeria japonica]
MEDDAALQNQLGSNGGSGSKRKKQSAAHQAGSKEDITIDFSEEMEEDRSFWENQAVIARIIGLNWSKKAITEWVEGNWGSQVVIKFIPKGFFVVLFEEELVRDSILNQRSWFVNKHALYLQPWTPNFNPIPLVYYSAPIWIRLYNLPIKYWGDGFLKKVGRTLGTLLEVDVDDEADLCKYARLRVAVVRRIPESISLLTANGEWRQQLEIEKEIRQCQRCGSRMHGEEGCKLFVRKARKVFRKLIQNWKRKSVSLEKTVTEMVQPLAAQLGSKEKIAESSSKTDGKHTEAKGDETSFNPVKVFEGKPGSLACQTGGQSNLEKTLDKSEHIEHNRIVMDANGGEGSANHKGPDPTCIFSTLGKGLSDTEFEYDKGSDEDFLLADELDNVDPRCISQSANVLLRKSKGFRGRRSNRRLREDRAKEKGIISVMDFIKKAKGDRLSLGDLEKSENWIFGVVRSLKDNVPFPLFNVYGPTKTADKAKVWKDIMAKIVTLNKDKVIVAEVFEDQEWVNQIEASMGPWVADYFHHWSASALIAIEEVINGKIQGVNYKYISKWDLDMEKVWSLKQTSDHRLKDERLKRRDVDEFGVTLKAFSGPVGFATNDVAEISTLEVGLKWCALKRIDKLVIEGDSQIILNGISSSKFQNWRLDNWTPRIKLFFNSLGDFHIQHMYQEGNKVADVLANLGIEESDVREFDSVEFLPEAVRNIISQDRDSIPRQGIG